MLLFSDQSNMNEYIVLLEKVIMEMSSTLNKIAQKLEVPFSQEEIISDYKESVEPPTALEFLLSRKDYNTIKNELRFNRSKEWILKELDNRISDSELKTNNLQDNL